MMRRPHQTIPGFTEAPGQIKKIIEIAIKVKKKVE
jgi:hypothetical protein